MNNKKYYSCQAYIKIKNSNHDLKKLVRKFYKFKAMWKFQ